MDKFSYLLFALFSFRLLFGKEIDECDMKMTSTRFARVLNIKQQGPGPMETLNPFLFCVYHKDEYPSGNEKMEVPNVIGNGSDFDPNKPFRMYHGKKIPGFPKHPHRGFETITATLEGTIDHSDSQGNAGRYGSGDLQWMTAGKGIVHGENFPLISTNQVNTLKLFQIWLNLPKKNKMVEPEFVMHWTEKIEKFLEDKGKVELTLYAGKYKNSIAQKPTTNSWATNVDNKVAIYYLKLQSNGNIIIPQVNKVDGLKGKINRVFYIVEGQGAIINDKSCLRKNINFGTFVEVESDFPTEIKAKNGAVEILMLQGREIVGETVVQYGPFVMNSKDEIQQAYDEFRKTQFGGWPWKEDAVIFPKSEERFSLIKKVKNYPPT